MGKTCVIDDCDSRYLSQHKTVSFHKFSRLNTGKYQKWISAISDLNNQPNIFNHSKSATICSKHFTEDCYIPGEFVRKLKEHAVPSIFPRNKEMSHVNYIVDHSRQAEAPPDVSRKICHSEPGPSTSALSVCDSTNLPTTPKRIVRCRYPGDIPEDLDNATPKTLRNYVGILKKQLENQKKNIKRLETTATRRKHRIQKLEDVIRNFREKDYISERTMDVVQKG